MNPGLMRWKRHGCPRIHPFGDWIKKKLQQPCYDGMMLRETNPEPQQPCSIQGLT